MSKSPTIKLAHPCQFGSSAELSIGKNSAHAVLAIRESGRLNSIALTPDGLRTLAIALNATADALEGEKCQPEAPWYPDDGNWIEWGGGERPVPAETRVQVLLRSERDARQNSHAPFLLRWERARAEWLQWEHANKGCDIVAYRVVEAR